MRPTSASFRESPTAAASRRTEGLAGSENLSLGVFFDDAQFDVHSIIHEPEPCEFDVSQFDTCYFAAEETYYVMRFGLGAFGHHRFG